MRSSRAVVASAVLVGAAVVAVWTSFTATPLPPVPSAPIPLANLAPPPPPPPPPPLAPGERSAPVTFTYATTSYVAVGDGRTPRKVLDQRAVYPPLARINGVTGTVIVDASIDQFGRVVAARVRQSVPMLDQSAVDAVRQWRFEAQREPRSITASIVYQ